MFNKILLIDDDPRHLETSSAILTGYKTESYSIGSVDTGDFQQGMADLKTKDYDLVILDLCQGSPSPESEKVGEQVLEQIKSSAFIPVIFFTGMPAHVRELESEIIKVVSKADSYEGLYPVLQQIAESGFLSIKQKVSEITAEALRRFFWDFVHPAKQKINAVKDDVSLGYLLLRRLANTLSKEHIRELLKDDKIKEGLAHPMEFYIYPPLAGEYECGEILFHEDGMYVVLTPSCDLVKAPNRPRKAEKILLACCVPLEDTAEYKKFTSNSAKYTDSLRTLIESRKSDRYFFLPETPFMANHVVDFQFNKVINYDDLAGFNRVAKLDDPFAQSMVSNFIRYYNRVGYPDLDASYILSKLEVTQASVAASSQV